MPSLLTNLCRGLLALALLASTSPATWAQSTPGSDNPSLTGAVVDDGSAPDESRDPKETGIDDGDAMSSGLAGDVVKGGDSGGQDLPPDLGDDGDDDPADGGGGEADGGDDDSTEENTGEEGGDRSHGDGSKGYRAHTVHIVMDVTVTSADGSVVRTVRLHFKQHQGRTALVSASASQPSSSRAGR